VRIGPQNVRKRENVARPVVDQTAAPEADLAPARVASLPGDFDALTAVALLCTDLARLTSVVRRFTEPRRADMEGNR
jgi:hypothetical protein